MAKKYKATVIVDFKINEKGELKEYKIGDEHITYSKKRFNNMKQNKLIE